MDRGWEEGVDEVDVVDKPLADGSKKGNPNKSSSSKSLSISSQLGNLDPGKIYWNDDQEIYVHVGGMCLGLAK